jgi:NADH:ubiquinone oxidoreductase subunit C
MDKNQLTDFIKTIDQELDIVAGKQFTEVNLPPAKLLSLAKHLREHADTQFDFLFCISGIDYGKDLGVVYHMRSTKYGHSVVLRTRISDRTDPHVDSVSEIWKTAEFYEREVFDLLGIKFNNHPDLRRLFLDSTWGFPLRKDYVDDINIVTK